MKRSNIDRPSAQRGFSVIDAILVLASLAIIAAIGWYVYRHHHPATTTETQTVAPSTATHQSNPSPLSAADFQGRGRFSVSTGIEMFNDTDSNFNAQLDGIKSLGASWVRSGIAWQAVETAPGVYDWSKADRLVNGVTSRGLKLIADVTEAPKWSKATSNYGCSGQNDPDFKLEDYAAFVQNLARRYQGKVDVWELDNEPNLAGGDWSHPNTCQYAAFLHQGYQAIKAVEPTSTVLSGGMGGISSKNGDIPGDTFIAGLYANGAAPYFDAVAYHPYTYPGLPTDPGVRGWTQMLNVRATMVAHGDAGKLIWVTEYGAPANGGYTNAKGKVQNGGTEAGQSQLLGVAYNTFSSYSWAGPLSWFEYRDRISGPKTDKDLGLVNATYTKRLAWTTYYNLAHAP